MEGYVPATRDDMFELARSDVAKELGFKARGYANYCTLCPRDPECHPKMSIDQSRALCDLPRDQFWVPEHVPTIIKINQEN